MAHRSETPLRIALYQPDMAGNVGTILRTAACLGFACDIIEPCGFPFDDRRLRRAGMDYAARAEISRHADWEAFEDSVGEDARLILMTSGGDAPLTEIGFRPADIILMGSESAGVPSTIHDRADRRATIPMRPGFRSLNVAVAAGIAMAEALRQCGVVNAQDMEAE